MSRPHLHQVCLGTLLVIAAVASVEASINCTSRQERGDAYEQCFNDQGLQAPDIFDSYRNSNSDDLDEVPVEDMFIHHGDSFCTNHSMELKAAVRCSYVIDTDCASPLERSLMPSPDDMANTMDPICQNLDNMDFTCIKGRQAATGDCVAKRAANELANVNNINQLKCLSRLITAECLKREYKACGCTSSKVYSDFTMDILLPNSCDQTTSRVVCSTTNPNEFVDDGLSGVTRQEVTTGLLVISILVIAMLF